MTKTAQKLLAAAMLAGFLGSAQAAPFSGSFTPESPPVTLTTGVPYNFNISLLGSGFDPFSDFLSTAFLSLGITNSGGQSITIGADSSVIFNGTLNALNALGSLELTGDTLAALQTNGQLAISLTKGGGQGSTFSFTGASLTAEARVQEQDPSPVPEPGTLALLGLGLLGGILVRRRNA